MDTVALVNALGLSDYALEDLGQGQSAVDKVSEYLGQLGGLAKAWVLTDRPDFRMSGVEPVVGSLSTVRELLGELIRLSQGCDDVLYVYADCPFLEPSATTAMLGEHREYFADYSFADGYPYGMTPEILRRDSLPRIMALAGDEPITRSSLFDTIRKDINSFDIETRLAPHDLRLLRVSLTADNRRNTLLVRRVEQAVAENRQGVLEVIMQSGGHLRTLPAFYNIQIIEGCPQNCSYCPYPALRKPALGKQGEMPLDDFVSILNSIQACSGDAVISVSLWGEPAYHSAFADLCGAVSVRDGLEMIVETSGVGWHEAVLHRIAETCRRPPRWIVSLDAVDPELYAQLRGEGREEALATVDSLLELFPGRVHVQAVRMQDNEADLEEFYRIWKKRIGDNVIIQKYDDFCRTLPALKVTDLSPLQRMPCWHLRRDICVLIDGTVPMCREDLARKHVLGNILQEPLEEIWRRGEPLFKRHVGEDYPELCRGCDEYYTYNF